MTNRLASGFLVAALLPMCVTAEEPTTDVWKQITVPGHGVLELQVPPAWRLEPTRAAENLPPTIEFTPPTGDAFNVQLTVFWSPTGDRRFNELPKVRKAVEYARDTAKASATTRKLPILELQGVATAGYYFAATDKAPKPGEWRYLTHGSAALDDLLLTFTILSNDPNQPEADQTLAMIKQARKGTK